MLLWTSLEIWLFFFTKIKWWIFSSILHKWKMDFYSLNPMDYQWNLIPPIPGSFWMYIFEIILLFFLGHFELKLIECPQRHYAFPKCNSCLHCIRNVLIQQKLMRSFKYLDSLFCYLGKHFKDILESAIY